MFRDLAHSMGRSEHLFQEVGRRGCLTVGWGVPGCERCQQEFEGSHQSSRPVVLSRDVHGAVPVTFPECRSQVANGTLDSCCCHRLWTEASISAIWVEASFLEADKETFGQEDLLLSGNEMEAGVISACVLEEPGPPFPNAFDSPMSFFLF